MSLVPRPSRLGLRVCVWLSPPLRDRRSVCVAFVPFSSPCSQRVVVVHIIYHVSVSERAAAGDLDFLRGSFLSARRVRETRHLCDNQPTTQLTDVSTDPFAGSELRTPSLPVT